MDLETQMRGSDFIFDCVNLLYYKSHKINFKRGGSYIDSTDWIKKKKATRNPKNSDDRWFQYADTMTLHFGTIKNRHKTNCKTVNNLKKKNPTVALNVLHIKEK